MHIAFQVDPIEAFVTSTDTSFALMLEAQERSHEVWVCEPQDVFFCNGVLKTRARKVNVRDSESNFFSVVETTIASVSEFSFYLIRQDPPFDMRYMANTLLLEAADSTTLVLNSPSSIRNVSEKLSALQLRRLIPPTFVGSNMEAITEFAAKFDEVVIKPLFLSGGRMIVRTKVGDENFDKYVEAIAKAEHGAVIVQKFLPGVMTNDKRVIFIEGDPVAVLGRLPKTGDFRANVHAGGKAVPAELTAGEEQVCREVADFLKAEDVFLAGVDLIDGYLTEINVTSPTLMRETKAIGGPDVAKIFWDRAELKAKKSCNT
jgi:glutathione synthase